jgi:hypothetical protein
MHALAAAHARQCRVALFLALVVAGGCSRPLPGDLKVGEITTGRILGADGTISDESNDEPLLDDRRLLHASRKRRGAAQNVPITARWTGPDGQIAAEVTKDHITERPTVTAFEARAKEGRWPAGDYKAEILVAGPCRRAARTSNAR